MTELEQLAEQVQQLEARLSGLRRSAGAGAVIVIAALVMSQGIVVAALLMSQPKPSPTPQVQDVGQCRVVEAEEFVLKDPEGQVLGRWRTLPGGTTELELNNSDRRASVRCTVAPDGEAALTVTSVVANEDGRDGRART